MSDVDIPHWMPVLMRFPQSYQGVIPSWESFSGVSLDTYDPHLHLVCFLTAGFMVLGSPVSWLIFKINFY
jgi:hypothetical protein